MNAYSEDLRKKIIEALNRGTGKSETARSFGVSLSSVKRYARMAQEGKPLAPKKRPGSRPKMDESAKKLLESDMHKRPAATLPQRREYLQRVAAGLKVSDSTVSRMLKRMGWSRKKDRWVPARERDEWLRAAWRVMIASEAGIDARRLVFVDLLGAPTPRSLPYTTDGHVAESGHT